MLRLSFIVDDGAAINSPFVSWLSDKCYAALALQNSGREAEALDAQAGNDH
jgi:hypothetical protein